MVIELTHPKYGVLEMEHGSLRIKGADSELTLYQELVNESAVTVINDTIHIVALLNNQRLVHWYGERDLISEDLGMVKQLIKGLQLVTDCNGKIHLFYLQQNIKQHDYSLIQRVFTDSWSDQLRVTTNISTMSYDYNVCPGLEKYLHLNYVGLEGDTLFYRCLDLDSKLWSGAIPLVREECSRPQLYINTSNLLLTWIGDTEEGKRLKANWLKNTWGKPVSLSSISKEIRQPGISIEEDYLLINWIEGSDLCFRKYDQNWSELMKVSLEEKVQKNKTVIVDGSKVCCTRLIYEPFTVKVVEAASSDTAPYPNKEKSSVTTAREVALKDTEEQKERKALENKFWQEAFQLHHEWQKLRGNYQEVLDQAVNIEQRLEDRLRELLAEDASKNTDDVEKQVRNFADELQLTNQRVVGIRDDLRRMREAQANGGELVQRLNFIESQILRDKKLTARYLEMEKRISIVENRISSLSQQIAVSANSASKKSKRVKTLLKRLIWK